jgi:hypothetical protein
MKRLVCIKSLILFMVVVSSHVFAQKRIGVVLDVDSVFQFIETKGIFNKVLSRQLCDYSFINDLRVGLETKYEKVIFIHSNNLRSKDHTQYCDSLNVDKLLILNTAFLHPDLTVYSPEFARLNGTTFGIITSSVPKTKPLVFFLINCIIYEKVSDKKTRFSANDWKLRLNLNKPCVENSKLSNEAFEQGKQFVREQIKSIVSKT